jgi:hypothetical protein
MFHWKPKQGGRVARVHHGEHKGVEKVGSRRRGEGRAADLYDLEAGREMRARKIAGDHL